MNYLTLNLFGEDRKLRGQRGRYGNGSEAIDLIEDSGETWARLTVNPGAVPPKGTVWVKTWSENTELFEKMVEEGYIEPTHQTLSCGYAEAIACKVTDKLKPFID